MFSSLVSVLASLKLAEPVTTVGSSRERVDEHELRVHPVDVGADPVGALALPVVERGAFLFLPTATRTLRCRRSLSMKIRALGELGAVALLLHQRDAQHVVARR